MRAIRLTSCCLVQSVATDIPMGSNLQVTPETRQRGDRASRFVIVSLSDFEAYRLAFGKERLALHLRLFYGPSDEPLLQDSDTSCWTRHPILAGELRDRA